MTSPEKGQPARSAPQAGDNRNKPYCLFIRFRVLFVCLQLEEGKALKTSEFKRWLKSQGATFKEGSHHTKVYCNGKQTTLPRHQGEIPEGTRKAIIKQLGL